MTDQASSLREKVARIVDPDAFERAAIIDRHRPELAELGDQTAKAFSTADLILNLPEIKAGLEDPKPPEPGVDIYESGRQQGHMEARLVVAEAIHDSHPIAQAEVDAALNEYAYNRTGPGVVEELVEALKQYQRIHASVAIDLQSAHSRRGNGTTQWMSEEDRELRADFRAAGDAARTTLSRTENGGEKS